MNKKFLITLGIISIIAFVIRIQVSRELVQFDSQVSSPSSVTDMYTYKDLSEKILNSDFEKEFYYQPFYYAVFLPAIKFLFGKGIWPVVIIQCIISALTVWFSGLSAGFIRSHKTGILTAIIVTFSTVLILYTPYYLIATLQAFWISLLFYLCLRYINKFRFVSGDNKFFSRCVWSGGLGLITGISILTRGNVWFFVPGIIFILIFTQNKDKNYYKRLLFLIIIFLLFLIFPQIPFSYHNTKIKGELTGPSTAAGAVLSLGNTPESPPGGRDPGTGAGPMEYPETCKAWNARSDKIPVYVQMMRWFTREPLAFLELQFRKLLLFWDYREIPNNIAFESNGLKSNSLKLLGLLPVRSVETPIGKRQYIFNNFVPMSFFILAFGFAGLILNFLRLFKNDIKEIPKFIKHHISYYLLFYFIIAYWLGTAVFYILGRFRVPMIPLLSIVAACFISQIFNFLVKRRKAKFALYFILIFVLGAGTVLYCYSFYRFGWESGIMRIVRPSGVRVELDDSTVMIRDNGPMSFGSWRFFEFKEGINIQKEFVLPEVKPGYYSVEFKIKMIVQNPGYALFTINGQKFRFNVNKKGLITKSFVLKNLSGNEVVIKPEKLACVILYFIDNQRDYGRTIINGRGDPGGELVCSLYIKNQKPEMSTK